VSINNLGVAYQAVGDALWAAGRLRESIPNYEKARDAFAQAGAQGAGSAILYAYIVEYIVSQQAVLGDAAGAARTLATVPPVLAGLRKSESKGSMAPVIVDALGKAGAAFAALELDDVAAARRVAVEAVGQLQSIKPERGFQEAETYIGLYSAADVAGHAEYLLGDFSAAERDQRTAVEARKRYLTDAVSDRRDFAEKSTWLAMALAREGRYAEAAQVIAPFVKFQRELAAKNHGDRWQPFELACVLYAQAESDAPRRAALLREAAALIDSLPPALGALHDVRQWRERIRRAQRDGA
jgi:tetratricopeptide (TPR) repeat protein